MTKKVSTNGALTLNERRVAWQLFAEQAMAPATIAAQMNKPLSLIQAATKDREDEAVAFYIADRNTTKAARKACIRKETLIAILERRGVTRHNDGPVRGKAAHARVVAPAPIAALVVEVAPEDAVSFDDLGPDQCRYPFGNRPPYLFCGHDTLGVYCKHHHARSWVKPKHPVHVTDKQAA